MAYFHHHEQNHAPYPSGPAFPANGDGSRDWSQPDSDFDMMPQDIPLTYQEKLALRLERWKMIHGIRDFLLTLVGMVVILLLIAVIISLYTWVKNDISSSLLLITKAF